MKVKVTGTEKAGYAVSLVGDLDEMMGVLGVVYDVHEAFANVQLRHESADGGIADPDLVAKHQQAADEATLLIRAVIERVGAKKINRLRKMARAKRDAESQKGVIARLQRALGAEAALKAIGRDRPGDE